MKVRPYSWVLAGAYLLCGVLFFDLVARFEEMYSPDGLDLVLPALTRAALSLTRFGWLVIFAGGAAVILLMDRRVHSPRFHPTSLITLALVVGLLATALLLPAASLIIQISRPNTTTGASPG